MKAILKARTAATAMALALTAGASFLMAQDGKPPAHPYTKQHIYSETANPREEIAAAMKQARREHKRIILDFGGDWCGDCQVLDIYFHEPANHQLLEKKYILVHVWIGHEDRNLDVAHQYGVPVTNGVPGLAVIDARGKVLYSQGSGEFRDMRYMTSDSVTDFLNKWKG